MDLTLCKHCDHFVEENPFPESDIITRSGLTMTVRGYDRPIARWVHLDDCEQEYNHDAEPGETMDERHWHGIRPELFAEYPDGKVGPNSSMHDQRGKLPRQED